MALDAYSSGSAADPSLAYQARCVVVAVSAAVPYPSATAPVTATSVRPEELVTLAPSAAAAAADVAVAAVAESYSSSCHNPHVAVLFGAAVSFAASPNPSVSPLVS